MHFEVPFVSSVNQKNSYLGQKHKVHEDEAIFKATNLCALGFYIESGLALQSSLLLGFWGYFAKAHSKQKISKLLKKITPKILFLYLCIQHRFTPPLEDMKNGRCSLRIIVIE